MVKYLFLVGILLSAACDMPPTCFQQFSSRVKEVGGCNSAGFCSALLEDGTQIAGVYEPVVGGYLSANDYGCRKQ